MSSISKPARSSVGRFFTEAGVAWAMRKLFDGALVLMDGAAPSSSSDKPGLPGDVYIDGEYLVFWCASAGEWRRVLGGSF